MSSRFKLSFSRPKICLGSDTLLVGKLGFSDFEFEATDRFPGLGRRPKIETDQIALEFRRSAIFFSLFILILSRHINQSLSPLGEMSKTWQENWYLPRFYTFPRPIPPSNWINGLLFSYSKFSWLQKKAHKLTLHLLFDRLFNLCNLSLLQQLLSCQNDDKHREG